uniref:Uncharacterized protein n=1 Tax=Arundo donax TaxID=35708 RepID=A0A0A9DXC9_ARUDO
MLLYISWLHAIYSFVISQRSNFMLIAFLLFLTKLQKCVSLRDSILIMVFCIC